MTDEIRIRRVPGRPLPRIRLETGVEHTIVVHGPRPASTFTIPGTRFGHDSAFVRPSMAGAVRWVVEALDTDPDATAMIFGHTDDTGSETYNKDLSDRRAAAMLAMLTADAPLLDRVAEAESWGLDVYQAMLRALGPNPGPIDGETGALTEAAILGFQREYNAGVYHRDASRDAVRDVSVTGVMDEPTMAAVRDAYLVTYGADLSPRRWIGPKRAGCSEFVPLSGSAKDDRRVTLALFPASDAPRDEDFPCAESDASACPLDQAQGCRCPFFRELVGEPDDPDFAGDRIPFFDFQWLRGDDTHTHLSAVTALPDGTSVTFFVRRAERGIDALTTPDCGEGSPPEVGPALATISGEVRNGIAFAVWAHSAEERPFELEGWLVNLDVDVVGEEDAPDDVVPSADALFEMDGLQPPLFEIRGGGAWGLSTPPGHALHRVEFADDGGIGLAVTSTGFLVNFDASQGTIDAAEDTIVIAMATSDARLRGEQDAFSPSNAETIT